MSAGSERAQPVVRGPDSEGGGPFMAQHRRRGGGKPGRPPPAEPETVPSARSESGRAA